MSKYIEVEKADPYLYDHLDDAHRKAAKSALDEMPPADVVDKERYTRLLANAIIVSNALKEYQSADFVKVVRCKECIFSVLMKDKDGSRIRVCYYPFLGGQSVEDTFFCARGRRDNEHN